MATARTDHAQLTSVQLPVLTHVVFDNIEQGLYYYVCEREPGETFYDLYGRVTEKTADRVRIEVLARRRINSDGGESAWEDEDDEYYTASRDLINSCEQEMSSRFYLPLEAHTDASGGAP